MEQPVCEQGTSLRAICKEKSGTNSYYTTGHMVLACQLTLGLVKWKLIGGNTAVIESYENVAIFGGS